jgi:His-Xaa-Ser system radical SAM maturase HxsC
MKSYKGSPKYVKKQITGMICTSQSIVQRTGKVLIAPNGIRFPFGYRGVIVGLERQIACKVPTIQLESHDIRNFSDGDCVTLSPNGTVSVVWESRSPINGLFLTDACDQRCLMCPQPPSRHDEHTYEVATELLKLLKPEQVEAICVTGGEPTTLGGKFIDIMRAIKRKFDHAHVMILTNGKNFSNFQFAREFANIGLSNTTLCVSFHSDIEELNDEIAGVIGSFHKTTQGLYNLARFRQRVEIRHVISKLNAPRLEQFAHFVYRNFPFAIHTALMGMEMTGFAVTNYDQLWIDPYQYKHELVSAVKLLHRANLAVSVYNVPLCLLEQQTWPYARQSISGWKNCYLRICDGCYVKEKCCGFFSTSGDLLSTRIRPIVHEMS